MTTISIELPTEVFSSLRRSPREFASEMRMAAAIHWYARGEISQGKAAEIAGVARVAFIDELARQRVEAFVVDEADLKREIERE